MAYPPPPGPSPTPTPVPTVALLIDSITATENGAILGFHADTGAASREVSNEYMEKCEPAVGDYFCIFDSPTPLMSYLSATDYNARFPQS